MTKLYLAPPKPRGFLARLFRTKEEDAMLFAFSHMWVTQQVAARPYIASIHLNSSADNSVEVEIDFLDSATESEKQSLILAAKQVGFIVKD